MMKQKTLFTCSLRIQSEDQLAVATCFFQWLT